MAVRRANHHTKQAVSLTIECVNNLIVLTVFNIINALKLGHTIITINCSVFCTLLNIIVQLNYLNRQGTQFESLRTLVL